MPAPEASVSVATMTPYTRALMQMPEKPREAALGISLSVLTEAGLSPDDLIDPEARIPLRVCSKLVELTATVTQHPDLSLRAAAAARRGDFGTYEYVTSTCATLREAIEATCRYQPLLYDAGDVRLILEEEVALLRYRVTEGMQVPIGHIEFALTGMALASNRLLGTYIPPLEVRFTHPAPPYLDTYQQVFRAPVHFDSPHNELVIPRERLAREVVTADPKLNLILRRYADRLLEALPTLQPVSRAVRSLLRQRMEAGSLRLREIPEAMHMSERSLRRRLAEEGTNLQSILEEMRKELARQYLATSRLTVSEIAYRLGFSNPPSFHRAFQRWFGMSPMRYRRDRAASPTYHFLHPD